MPERDQLSECEEVIRRGLSTFVDVGRALARIRDGRLYRASHDSFETYCRAKWSLGKSHVYRLIEASAIASDVPHGGGLTERAVRPLALIEPEERASVMEEAAELAGDGPITSRHTEEAVARRTDRLAVHHSSESVEHYTPDHIVEAVREVFGGSIDLDPCADPSNNTGARTFWTEADDGLSRDWSGYKNAYMNPPYGRGISDWVGSLCGAYGFGLGQAIALVPARTDTTWFQVLTAPPQAVVCFLSGRLQFKGNDNPAPFPSAVVYLGPSWERFAEVFGAFGPLWERIHAET